MTSFETLSIRKVTTSFTSLRYQRGFDTKSVMICISRLQMSFESLIIGKVRRSSQARIKDGIGSNVM